jgi:hypothetical protein
MIELIKLVAEMLYWIHICIVSLFAASLCYIGRGAYDGVYAVINDIMMVLLIIAVIYSLKVMFRTAYKIQSWRE